MLLHHALSLASAAAPGVVAALRDRVGPMVPASRAAKGESARTAASASAIDLRVSSDLDGLEETWRAFEKEADGTVFQTFDWLSTWQRHIGNLGGTVPAVVTGRDASGALLFLLPLAVERRAFARRLTWLGADLCDYNGPLLSQRFTERFGATWFPALWQEILGLLRSDPRFRFDYVDLPKMLDTVGSQPNPFVSLEVHSNPSGAYVATLGTDWDAFYAANRSGPTRKKERKQLKQLAEHGEVRFVEVDDPAAIAGSMATLIEQKSHAFARMGVVDNFARPGYAPSTSISPARRARGTSSTSAASMSAKRSRRQASASASAAPTTSFSPVIRTASWRASGRAGRISTSCCATPSPASSGASISPSATSPTSATGRTSCCGLTTICSR